MPFWTHDSTLNRPGARLTHAPLLPLCAAAKAMEGLTGVVDHGLFLDMVDVAIIARADGVDVQEK